MNGKNISLGFTLIELLLTLGIAGVLLVSVLALPAYWVGQNRFMHRANQFWEALEFARSHAMITGSATTICGSDGGDRCTETTYEKGWIVFNEHPNSVNGVLDHGESILIVQQSDATDIIIRSTTFSHFITYDRLGKANYNGRFMLCKGRLSPAISELIINQSGRARLVQYRDGEQPSDIANCLL